MAVLLPDVAFPLLGGSTTALADGLPIRIIHVGGVTIDERWRGRDLCSPMWRIYINLDDGAEVVMGGRGQALAAGQVVVIPAWLHWAARCRGRVRHGNALVDLPTLGRAQVEAAFRGPVVVAGPGQTLSQRWQELLRILASTPVAGPDLHARGLALVADSLAVAFAGHAGGLGGLQTRSDVATAIVAAVDRSLHQSLPVPALARGLGISVAELGRRCRRDLQASPGRVIRTRRLVRAADLLRSGLPVATVAERCGFTDRTRFSKSFRAALGSSPAACRRGRPGPQG
jgi:AraC-like DNA-binding protein